MAMNSKSRIGVVAAALALPLLFGVMALVNGSGQAAPQKRCAPVWNNHPTSVNEAVDLGTVVVRATVVKVERAADIVVPAAGEPDGVDRVATQAITLRTAEVFKGSMPATFTVFRTGGAGITVDSDPAYRAGQQYVLILDSQRTD